MLNILNKIPFFKNNPSSFLLYPKYFSLSAKRMEKCGKKDPFATRPPKDPFASHVQQGSYMIYKVLGLMVGIPVIALFSGYLLLFSKEEKEIPPFVAYPYLHHITKKFPWGDGNHTLLHNPRKNALKEGYESANETNAKT